VRQPTVLSVRPVFPNCRTKARNSMNATYLHFYVHENVRHRHLLLYEWLLQHARGMGVHGGSVFRAVEGFGRHGVLHSQHFSELAGEMTRRSNSS